jgi:hypothetical protein
MIDSPLIALTLKGGMKHMPPHPLKRRKREKRGARSKKVWKRH